MTWLRRTTGGIADPAGDGTDSTHEFPGLGSPMSRFAWSWSVLVIYIGGMVGFGFVAKRKIRSADDFATSRRSYGPRRSTTCR